MTGEEKYKEFVNIVCEMLGFNKPIDILKLCQITSDFIRPYEMKIKELEKENERLKAQNEKMECCGNCKNLKYYEHALDKYECNIYDVSDISGVCNCDEWELAE